MPGDVASGHDAACRLDGPGDLLTDRPAVVGVPPAVGEGAKGRRKQRLPKESSPGPPAEAKTARAASSKAGRAVAIARAVMLVSS